MNIKNTKDTYGSIAKWLHWSTAFLFLCAYISVYYRQWFTHTSTPENWTALQLHLSFGVSIAVIVLLRIIWRLINVSPDLESDNAFEQFVAKAGHFALYAVMVVMPVTGYFGTGVATEFFFAFEIPKFEDTPLYAVLVEKWLALDFEQFEEPMDFIHKDVMGAWLVWLLILGHIGAALYHHFVRKDKTLLKMTRGNVSD